MLTILLAASSLALAQGPRDDLEAGVPECCTLVEPTASTGDEPRIELHAPSPAEARAAFERFKALDGDWAGKSTKGWTDRLNYRTIAGGSVVMETSFEAHPGETMATMIHLDGDRLLLTHYCVARNQPRLVLTGVSEDGTTCDFTFLDATNLASRDKGHMDRCLVRFNGPDFFTSRWTWYQDGQESWMEEIVNERVKDDATTQTTSTDAP